MVNKINNLDDLSKAINRKKTNETNGNNECETEQQKKITKGGERIAIWLDKILDDKKDN